MTRTLSLILTVCILGSSYFGQNKNISWQKLTVPFEISTKQEISLIPNEWAVNPNKNKDQLCGVTIFEGYPEENASLVYESKQNIKHNLILTWTFTGKEKNGIWIVCRYAETSIQIKKQLPKRIKMLRITYDTTIKIYGEPIIKIIEYN